MLKLLKIGVEIFLVSISENTTCRKPKKIKPNEKWDQMR